MRASQDRRTAGHTKNGLRLRLALLDLPQARDLVVPGMVLALVAALKARSLG